MDRSTARNAFVLLVVATLAALPIGVAVAADVSSGLVVDDRVDTVQRTVTVEGDAYNATSTGRVSVGDPLTVHVTGPKNVTGVHLFTREGELVTGNRASVNDTVTFETTSLTPGEYVLASHDTFGVFIDAYPVVVAGYDTSVSASNAASATGGADDSGGDAGGSGTGTAAPSASATNFTVHATDITTSTDAPEIDGVDVVVRADGDVTRLNATSTSDDTFVATTTLEPGTYRVYATVSTAGTNGTGELVGLSDVTTVTVTNGGVEGTPNATTVDAAATDGGFDFPGTVTLPVSLTAGRLTGVFGGSTLLVGLLVVALLLSTVVYQTMYTLRRR